ncbi:hypothetical protein PoB_002266300 [Plakobranchus ocellatus]|uniref:Uncharacterized protein n=1 Tax=Plakobranchus ocellatus TaxID=259542 RepID=A0AAV3ZNW2_9GAST|nr:hypothetical protein PoB_002266300 [Plakobranchus ocellatus]
MSSELSLKLPGRGREKTSRRPEQGGEGRGKGCSSAGRRARSSQGQGKSRRIGQQQQQQQSRRGEVVSSSATSRITSTPKTLQQLESLEAHTTRSSVIFETLKPGSRRGTTPGARYQARLQTDTELQLH